MRLQPFLLALALGCAAEDSKTNDTSSNGFGDSSGDEGIAEAGASGDASEDMGNLLSQVEGLVTEMAEMSAKIAAQQATIAQLEMQMSQTLRWETFEHTCATEDGRESTGVTADGAVTATAYHTSGTGNYFRLDDQSPDFRDGEVTVDCSDHDSLMLVTVGYER